MRVDARKIDDQAVAWLIRRDSADWSEADATQLTVWLNASTANRVAFLRLEVGWGQSERLAALGAGKPRGVVPARGQWRVSPFFEPRLAIAGTSKKPHRRRPLIALAASLLAGAALAACLMLVHSGDGYATPIGGTASIPLRDGSNITLNTASKIRVAVTGTERRVELEQGEAYFDVAKDRSRPFIVIAGNQRVVAIGTRFSVLREKDDVRVVVTEGKVRFEPTSAPLNFGPGSERPAAPLLAAGAIARASDSAVLVETKPLQRAEEILSWRSGYLTFDETTLADAVAEFDRYNTRKIYIQDPGVAALRINGKFRATNAAAFIRVLRDGFGIRAQESEGRIVLSAN
jgi:transmembrane sensor